MRCSACCGNNYLNAAFTRACRKLMNHFGSAVCRSNYNFHFNAKTF